MTKKVRMSLYVLSLAITTAVLILLLFHNRILGPGKDSNSVVQEHTRQENTEQQSDKEQNKGKDTIRVEQWEEVEDITQAEKESTTLIFSGDIMITNASVDRYNAGGIESLLTEEILTEMTHADICMINNEFQYSNRGTPMEGKQYTFRTDPENVQMMLDMGVDIVNLANNHSIDFGTIALEDTFTTLEDAGILYSGAGMTKERAEELQTIEVNGKKFGFLSATRVIPVTSWNVEYRQPGLFTTYDDTRLVECIKAAKEECDFLTVYVHWGVERVAYPVQYQKVMARHFVDAGADLIIASHPHVLQGIEFMDGVPVFYSLGNFLFYQTIEKTALVKVVIQPDGTPEYYLLPVYVSGGVTGQMQGAKASALYDYMNEISIKDYVDENGRVRDVE